jgi:hypothetical protein
MAQSGLAALSYKRFMTQKLPGAITLAASFVDCIDPEHIRVKRSARHSNFPECNLCQRRRADYIKVMSIPGTTKAAVDEAYAELQAHMVQWQGDRKVALAMKDHSSGLTRATCYECDDKCGSQWCELPVASGGRGDNVRLNATHYPQPRRRSVTVDQDDEQITMLNYTAYGRLAQDWESVPMPRPIFTLGCWLANSLCAAH